MKLGLAILRYSDVLDASTSTATRSLSPMSSKGSTPDEAASGSCTLQDQIAFRHREIMKCLQVSCNHGAMLFLFARHLCKAFKMPHQTLLRLWSAPMEVEFCDVNFFRVRCCVGVSLCGSEV